MPNLVLQLKLDPESLVSFWAHLAVHFGYSNDSFPSVFMVKMEDTTMSDHVEDESNNQKDSYDARCEGHTLRQQLLVEQQHREIQVFCFKINLTQLIHLYRIVTFTWGVNDSFHAGTEMYTSICKRRPEVYAKEVS